MRGYLAIFLNDGQGGFAFNGYITLDEQNYKGNDRAKFGTYAVPAFYDLDGDGALDLVCGSLEYGLAYPIDSPYFPERAALEAQVDFAEAHHLYVGIHHYSNAGASEAREAYELERHLEAFETYGLPTEGIGANLHTWYSSNLGDTQTFDSEYAAGLLWNSGFSPAYDTGVAPQYAAENVIALPFFLQKDGEGTLLVQDNSVLPYVDSAWTTDLSGEYRMPVCIYYHCDFVYESDLGARDYLQKVSDFQWKFGYNFVREDQLMAASAEALALTVDAKTQNGALTIAAKDDTSVGVEIQFSQDHSAAAFAVDADVWYQRGNSLFVSLNRPVTLTAGEPSQTAHLTQVNLPADITLLSNGAEIAFEADGMLQVVVAGDAVAASAGWDVETRDGKTIFTKYGEGGHPVPSLQQGDRRMNSAVCMLDEAAAHFGARVALEDEQESLTYEAYRQRALAIGSGLLALGSARRPVVVYLPKSVGMGLHVHGRHVRRQPLCPGGFPHSHDAASKNRRKPDARRSHHQPGAGGKSR